LWMFNLRIIQFSNFNFLEIDLDKTIAIVVTYSILFL